MPSFFDCLTALPRLTTPKRLSALRESLLVLSICSQGSPLPIRGPSSKGAPSGEQFAVRREPTKGSSLRRLRPHTPPTAAPLGKPLVGPFAPDIKKILIFITGWISGDKAIRPAELALGHQALKLHPRG